jgi:hypothetical protein
MGATVAGRAPTHETGTGPVGAGPWLTLPRLWLVVVLGGIAVMELAQVPSAVDLAYHLKVGELIVAERAVPRTDMLAWTTSGQPWLDQNWGAQVALYGIWRLGGLPLLTVASSLCAVVTWGLVAAACRRRTANLRLIAGAVLAGYAAAAAGLSPRPQLFSMLLFAAELYLLEVARTRPRVALAIPLLMVLWANLHGAFVVGVGLLVIEVAAAVWRRDRPVAARYLLVTVASLAGLLVNPWGARVLGYAISFPANPTVTGFVSEWGPATLRQLPGTMILVAIGVLVVALVRVPSPGRAPEQLLRMALLAALALWAIRAGAWFGLALPVALCALARQESPAQAGPTERGVPVLSGLVLAVLAVALVAASPPVTRALLSSRPEPRRPGWPPTRSRDGCSTTSRGAHTWSSASGPGCRWGSTPGSNCRQRASGAATTPSSPDDGTPSGCSTNGGWATWSPAGPGRPPWSSCWRRRAAGGWCSRAATSGCTCASRRQGRPSRPPPAP